MPILSGEQMDRIQEEENFRQEARELAEHVVGDLGVEVAGRRVGEQDWAKR